MREGKIGKLLEGFKNGKFYVIREEKHLSMGEG